MAFNHIKSAAIWGLSGVMAVTLIGPLTNYQIDAGATAYAQAAKDKKKERKTRRAAVLNSRLAPHIKKAGEGLEEDDTDKALEALGKANKLLSNPKGKFSSYDRATVWLYYASVYATKEDFTQAIGYYEKINGLPEDLDERRRASAVFALGQLYFQQEKYAESAAMMEKWLGMTPIASATAYALLGQAYYQQELYDKAVPQIQTAIKLYKEKGKKPKETWYALLRGMYYSQEKFQETFDVLRILADEYPKKSWFIQLAAMYGELNKEFEQYSMVAALDDAELLDREAELISYAQFLLAQERPYRAARVLEEGVKNKIIAEKDKTLVLLANSWQIAREDKKAIPVLQRAAKISADGNAYSALGQALANSEQWVKAEQAARNAAKKGKLKRPDVNDIILGMSLFNQKKYSASLKALARCKKDERSKKMCTQWTSYVKGERDRERKLKASGL